MDDMPGVSQLPWAIDHERFLAAAAEITGEGACCLFLIDESIPSAARSGYAALVIAYARADEPVTVLRGGAAAILIREGGTRAAETAARRLLRQMSKLGLQQTLRAAVTSLDGGIEAALAQARSLAAGTDAGGVAVGGAG